MIVTLAILLKFCQEVVVKNLKKFNEIYSYDYKSINIKKLISNGHNIRVELGLMYVAHQLDRELDESEINDIRHKLKQLNKIGLERKLDFLNIDDRDFEPEWDSDSSSSEINTSFSSNSKRKRKSTELDCLRGHKLCNRPASECEELRKKLEFYEARDKEMAKGGQGSNYGVDWGLLGMFCISLGLSFRQCEKLFKFMGEQIKACGNWSRPGKSYFQSLTYTLPTVLGIQIGDFIRNSQHLIMGIDGTSFRNCKVVAVVIFNENLNSVLVGMEYILQGDHMSVVDRVYNVLGEYKEEVLGKLKGIISDTEAAQIKADKVICQDVENLGNGRCYLNRC